MKKILTVFLLFFSFANFTALRADVAADLKQAIDKFDADEVEKILKDNQGKDLAKIINDNHVLHHAIKRTLNRYRRLDNDREEINKKIIGALMKSGAKINVLEAGDSPLVLLLERGLTPFIARIIKSKKRTEEIIEMLNLKGEFFRISQRSLEDLGDENKIVQGLRDRLFQGYKEGFFLGIYTFVHMISEEQVLSLLEKIEEAWKKIGVDATKQDRSKKFTHDEKPLYFTHLRQATVEGNSSENITMLYAALRRTKFSTKIISRLLELGANVNERRFDVYKLSPSLMPLLIDAGMSEKDARRAIKKGISNKDIADKVYEKINNNNDFRFDYDRGLIAPILLAFELGRDKETIEKMLDYGADVDVVFTGKDEYKKEIRYSLLGKAIEWAQKDWNNRSEIIERMVACGARLTKQESKYYTDSSVTNILGNPISLLLTKYRGLLGKPWHQGGTQLLRTFVKNQDIDNVKKLLEQLSVDEKKLLLNRADYNGKVPLIYALEFEIRKMKKEQDYNASITKILLDNGAIANVPESVFAYGRRKNMLNDLITIDPMYKAIEHGNSFLLEKFVDHRGTVPVILLGGGEQKTIKEHVEQRGQRSIFPSLSKLKLDSVPTPAPGPQPEQSQEAQSLNEKTGVLVKVMEKFKDSLDQLAKTLGIVRQGLQQGGLAQGAH